MAHIYSIFCLFIPSYPWKLMGWEEKFTKEKMTAAMLSICFDLWTNSSFLKYLYNTAYINQVFHAEECWSASYVISAIIRAWKTSLLIFGSGNMKTFTSLGNFLSSLFMIPWEVYSHDTCLSFFNYVANIGILVHCLHVSSR